LTPSPRHHIVTELSVEGMLAMLPSLRARAALRADRAIMLAREHIEASHEAVREPDHQTLELLAAQCPTATGTTGRAGVRTYLLVERYDCQRMGNRWRRLHQQDFYHALGKPPAAQYETNQIGIKGPTFADMFGLTRTAKAAPDLLALLDAAIFNVAVCNTDAHAKNYSLMITARGFTLTRLYDVMCAAAWDGVSRNLAQIICDKNRGEHLKRRHWEAFALACGLSLARVVARVRALVQVVQRELDNATTEVEAIPAGGHVMLPAFKDAIQARTRAMLAGLYEDSAKLAVPSLPKLPANKANKRTGTTASTARRPKA
jgi:serine/threonine-protein kinase HipA